MPREDCSNKGSFKVSKKFGRFNETIRKATLQLAKRSAACAVIQQEVQWAQEREKVRSRVIEFLFTFLRLHVRLPVATHAIKAGLHTDQTSTV
jgi:hypothetical protein